MGQNKDGNVLFIFFRSPYSIHDFNEILKNLPINIACAQHQVKGTAGQTFTGITDNSKYILQAGFWYGSGLVTDAIQTPIVMLQQYQLKQNYPNPFNPGTTIRYNLPRAADVRISIYNMSGRKVQTLIRGRQPAGEHSLYWDASRTASGIYFIRMESAEAILVKKCVLVK
ncbi:T9SS type A sorting domain-containing protein [bacterium]|nr:T9SS type A sorting domain-containing protein [bacterium]